jgi:hypothetical protein
MWVTLKLAEAIYPLSLSIWQNHGNDSAATPDSTVGYVDTWREKWRVSNPQKLI